jgi:hypothetical protein
MDTSKDLAKNVVSELIENDKFRCMFKSLISESLDEKLTSLNNKIDTIKTEYNCKMDEMRTEFDGKLEEMRGELHETRVENETLAKKNEKLKDDLNITTNNAMYTYNGLATLQQETLRNSLRITGVPEAPIKRDPETKKIIPENTEQVTLDIALKTGVTLQMEDLDSATRIPKPMHARHTATPRPIEVKFTRRIIRQKVLSSRRQLKGTGVGVHEVLSKSNQIVYEQAKDMVKNVAKATKVWTWDGITTILVEDEGNSTKYRVRNLEQIKQIAETHS